MEATEAATERRTKRKNDPITDTEAMKRTGKQLANEISTSHSESSDDDNIPLSQIPLLTKKKYAPTTPISKDTGR